MTAVTLSPHQLATLQQQHRDLPAAENPRRPSPPLLHANHSASAQHLGRTNAQPSEMEDSAQAMENRQRNTSADRPDQKKFAGKGPRGGNPHLHFDLGDRSNMHASLRARESNSSSSISDDQSQQLPKQAVSEQRNVRPKTALGSSRTEAPASYLVAISQQVSDVEAVPHAGTNGYGRPKRQLLRAKSDLGPRGLSPTRPGHTNEDENWQMRHGWEDQYNSNEYLSLLTSVSRNIYLKVHA